MCRCSAMALALAMASAHPALAGPPFVTDDPDVVDPGHWEIDGFTTGSITADDQSAQLPGLEVNYGVAPDLMVNAVIASALDHPSGAPSHAGLADTQLAAEYRFIDPGNRWNLPEVALYPSITIPSATHGLGAGHAQGFVPLWLEQSWGNWTAYGGAGYGINPGRGAQDYWYGGAVLQNQITDHLALGGELFHQTPSSTDARAITGFNLGAVYDINTHYHVLASAGSGLQNPRQTNEFSYYLALQWTF